MKRLAIAFCLSALASIATAQEARVGSYNAFIGTQDLVNSSGIRLENAAQVLRQDRANVHRFNILQAGDTKDFWFFAPDSRAAMESLFAARGGIPATTAQAILRGNVPVVVYIYARDGNFTGLEVVIPG
ncbi:hypothetical protein [Algicella marina]|uniref:Uncharacterized protein n=1 Tax=Algicella marina TaxID=2683284 RepID=A0A6P1T218_9RHOB|nr:hypothetical protein [Algicella marina]QHQ35703.1 hypothetical protein GO499_11205 [Algicella marina]